MPPIDPETLREQREKQLLLFRERLPEARNLTEMKAVSVEIRRLEGLLQLDSEPEPEPVSADEARQAFEAAMGPVDPDLFERIRDEARNKRLLPRPLVAHGRSRSDSDAESVGAESQRDWWALHGASAIAVMEYRRAARRLGHDFALLSPVVGWPGR